MKWIALLVSLVWTAQTFAEVAPLLGDQHFSDEELVTGCTALAAATTIAYTARNILPADATEEDGRELMTQLMKGDSFREMLGDEAHEQLMSDPFFDEAVELAVSIAWVHPHHDDYGLSKDEKLQDITEFQEDMLWMCQKDMQRSQLIASDALHRAPLKQDKPVPSLLARS